MVGIKLVVGLGNPGSRYDKTRHNAGKQLIQQYAATQGLSWRLENNLKSEMTRLQSGALDVRLACPTTYMNESGFAVQKIAQFYKYKPQDILIIHDEVDLSPGTARLKKGGGHGGHNGLRDIMQRIGGDFYRIRIGVGHPGDKNLVPDYVLKPPAKAEAQAIEDANIEVLRVLDNILSGDFERVMNTLHTRLK